MVNRDCQWCIHYRKDEHPACCWCNEREFRFLINRTEHVAKYCNAYKECLCMKCVNGCTLNSVQDCVQFESVSESSCSFNVQKQPFCSDCIRESELPNCADFGYGFFKFAVENYGCGNFDEKQKPDDGWISIQDKLPMPGEHITVKMETGRVISGKLTYLRTSQVDGKNRSAVGHFGDVKGFSIAYWKLLPEKPKEEKPFKADVYWLSPLLNQENEYLLYFDDDNQKCTFGTFPFNGEKIEHLLSWLNYLWLSSSRQKG